MKYKKMQQRNKSDMSPCIIKTARAIYIINKRFSVIEILWQFKQSTQKAVRYIFQTANTISLCLNIDVLVVVWIENVSKLERYYHKK